MIWNVPNIITVIRLIVAILFVPAYFYEQTFAGGHAISLSLYIFASATDVIDGYIARKYNLITEFGKIFDPIADKLFQFIVVVCISFIDPVYIWLSGFILIKEICMAIGTIKLYKNKQIVQANLYGKFASVVYFILFFVLIGFKENINKTVELVLICSFVAAATIAFINYFNQYFKLKVKK